MLLQSGAKTLLQTLYRHIEVPVREFCQTGCLQEQYWRLPFVNKMTAYPHYKEALVHRRHRVSQYQTTYGLQKTSKLKCVDNSALGRQAVAIGKPPKVIHVYSNKHRLRRHGEMGKLGDRVLMAVCGQKKKGIIVGMRQQQLHGIPKYDTNNVVFVEENGNPTGNRITAPLPNHIRPILQKASDPKKADYTKLFSIATRWI